MLLLMILFFIFDFGLLVFINRVNRFVTNNFNPRWILQQTINSVKLWNKATALFRRRCNDFHWRCFLNFIILDRLVLVRSAIHGRDTGNLPHLLFEELSLDLLDIGFLSRCRTFFILLTTNSWIISQVELRWRLLLCCLWLWLYRFGWKDPLWNLWKFHWS